MSTAKTPWKGNFKNELQFTMATVSSLLKRVEKNQIIPSPSPPFDDLVKHLHADDGSGVFQVIYQLHHLCFVGLDFALDRQGTRADLQLSGHTNSKNKQTRVNFRCSTASTSTQQICTAGNKPEVEPLAVYLELSYLVLDVDACGNGLFRSRLFGNGSRLYATHTKINKQKLGTIEHMPNGCGIGTLGAAAGRGFSSVSISGSLMES